jgi:hypothetical protein
MTVGIGRRRFSQRRAEDARERAAFDRMPVSEIMTPRERISRLSVDDACETFWQKVVLTGHSNYPLHGRGRSRHRHCFAKVRLRQPCGGRASRGARTDEGAAFRQA